MTSKIDKVLLKLSEEERAKLKQVLTRIWNHDIVNLDLKKLKGHDDIFRVRVGKMRIIFRRDEDEQIYIIAVERRSESTYNI